MSPERARLVIPPEAVVTAETRVNFYGGAWMIWARMGEYMRPVTQFAAADPFSAAHWLAHYDRLAPKPPQEVPDG